jgi:hypothetical protein
VAPVKVILNFVDSYRTDSNPCFVVICLASAVATISMILLLASGVEQASTATIATCSLVIDPPKKVSAHLQMNIGSKFRFMTLSFSSIVHDFG